MKGKRRKDPSATPEPETSGDAPVHGDTISWQARLERFELPIMFILAFLVFNTVSLVTITSSDVAPATFLPAALILNQNFYFDFATSLVTDPGLQYAFLVENGHYVSLFPVVTPILVTPVYYLSYLISNLFGLPITPEDFIILGKTSAALISAAAVVIFYCVAGELFRKRTALLATAVFALATPTWSISSQALWQTGMVELLLIALVYLIVKDGKEHRLLYLVLMGVLSGLFFFNRPPDALLLIPVIAYVLWYRRAGLPHYLLGACAGGLPFLWYNLAIFGNVLGGYKENLGRFVLGPGFIPNYAGLLIAPNVGLLVFAPVLVLAVFGFLRLRDIEGPETRQVLFLFGPVIALHILLYSLFDSWFSASGYCFGPRYLTGIVPILCIYTGIVFSREADRPGKTLQKRGIHVAIALLILASIAIQVIGVFYYPYNLDKTMPESRTWSLSDTLIGESFVTGSQVIEGITVYTLPPLPPLFSYRFSHASM